MKVEINKGMTFINYSGNEKCDPEYMQLVYLESTDHIERVIEEFRNFLLAVSFSEKTVDNYLDLE